MPSLSLPNTTDKPPKLRAKSIFRKLPGHLELTNAFLQWTQEGKTIPALRVPLGQANSLFCSKEGAPQVKLKLGILDDAQGHNFTFSAAHPAALADREKFKTELTSIISANRTRNNENAQPAPPPPVTAAGEPTKNPQSQTPQLTVTPLPVAAVHPHLPSSSSRAGSVASSRQSPAPSNTPMDDFRLRKRVLMKSPALAALHRDLVMAGQISESEFWEGRQSLLQAELAAENQKRGKLGPLVDPRPTSIAGGDVKIVVTPQLVHDIFEEYPVVALAYSENVPAKLSEAEFWKRYFQSKLFNSHRASIRSSATQHVVKDDAILDRYLEAPDDQLEPRHQRDERVRPTIDLGATNEDHRETGNTEDVTMQAGRQRGVLPLIRKFNQHSERLLNSALGDEPVSKKRRTGDVSDDEIDLEDLHDNELSEGIVLDMQDSQRYFETSGTTDLETGQKVDFRDAASASLQCLNGVETRLKSIKLGKKVAEDAVLSLTGSVSARLDGQSKKVDIPEILYRQMATCQTAANEFLRQFWSAVYPPSADSQTLAQATPQQRTAKLAKMAGYLSSTRSKVQALVNAAPAHNVQPTRVEAAFKPTLDAVDKALNFYSARKQSR